MIATTQSRTHRIVARVRETLDDIGYAQRRMTEIRMGLHVMEPGGRPGIAPTVAELEALYAHEDV
jgi:hypothetical protein